jgi:hypothetical protein
MRKTALLIAGAVVCVVSFFYLSWNLPRPWNIFLPTIIATVLSRLIAPLSKWFYFLCFTLIGPVTTYFVMLPIIQFATHDPISKLMREVLSSASGMAEVMCPPFIALAIAFGWEWLAKTMAKSRRGDDSAPPPTATPE